MSIAVKARSRSIKGRRSTSLRQIGLKTYLYREEVKDRQLVCATSDMGRQNWVSLIARRRKDGSWRANHRNPRRALQPHKRPLPRPTWSRELRYLRRRRRDRW